MQGSGIQTHCQFKNTGKHSHNCCHGPTSTNYLPKIQGDYFEGLHSTNSKQEINKFNPHCQERLATFSFGEGLVQYFKKLVEDQKKTPCRLKQCLQASVDTLKFETHQSLANL